MSGDGSGAPVTLDNGGYYENNGVTEAEAFAAQDELMALPSLEEGIVIAENMLAEIRQALDAAIGPRTWTVEDPAEYWITSGSCGGDYQLTNGRDAHLQWRASPPIPDDQWEGAMDALVKATKSFGFERRQDLWDGPGGHTSRLYDAHTGEVTILTEDERQTVFVSVNTGCRFTDAQKELVRTYGVPFDPTDPDDHSPWPFPTPDPARYQ